MRRRRGGIFLAAFLALAGLPAAAQAAPESFDPATAVTLITGDKVIPGANGSVLLPAPGRERQTFTTYQADGHTYVIPADAAPLLADKILDKRLFDVTELRAYRGTLPLIVKYSSQQRPFAQTAGVVDLPSINGAAIKADPASFWRGLTGKSLAASRRSGWTVNGRQRWTTASPRSGRPPRGRLGIPALA